MQLLTSLLILATAAMPQFTRLDSGLRLCVIEDATLPLVSVQLWFQVGSVDDPPQQFGLCHVLRTHFEHHDDLDTRMRAAGLLTDARTFRDACCFTTLLPPTHLEYVLELTSSRLRAPALTAADVERAVALAAGASGDSTDDTSRDRRVLATMFGNHGYAARPGDVSAALQDITPDAVNAFRERRFVPSNATVFVVGAVSAPQVAALFGKHFADLPWTARPTRSSRPLPKPSETELSLAGDVERIAYTVRTPPAGTRDNSAIDVLAHLLCNDVDGVLRASLTNALTTTPPGKPTKPVFTLSTGHVTWARCGWLTICVDLELPQQADAKEIHEAVAKTLRATLRHVADHPPDPVALNRARALLLRERRESRATLPTRAFNWAWHEIVAGDALLTRHRIGIIPRLGAADVQSAATALLDAPTIITHTYRDPPDSISNVALPPLCETADAPARSVPVNQLLAYTAAAPAPAAPQDTPQIITERWASGTNVYTCHLPQAERVCTWVVQSTDQPGFGIGERIVSPTLHSYLDYHGLHLLLQHPHRHCICVAGVGGPEDGGRLIELSARMLSPEHAAQPRPLDVIIVGNLADNSWRGTLAHLTADSDEASPAARRPLWTFASTSQPSTAPAIPPSTTTLSSRRREALLTWLQTRSLVKLDGPAAVGRAVLEGRATPWKRSPAFESEEVQAAWTEYLTSVAPHDLVTD